MNPLDVSCYTFGAPRVGNHAFARQYNALVPDTWSIINNQVSRRSKTVQDCMFQGLGMYHGNDGQAKLAILC